MAGICKEFEKKFQEFETKRCENYEKGGAKAKCEKWMEVE
jgi:hypothetical protein